MNDIFEHSDNPSGGDNTIQVGDAKTPISLKVYQDVYHAVTGRTEQIRQRYSDNLLIEFSELVSVFHEKERKEQFTSFERFRAIILTVLAQL